MLRKKFGKMKKAMFTEFMTNQVDINNNKIKKIVNESNGNAFLNLSTNGKADAQQCPFYLLFTPEIFIFCANKIELKNTFEKCCKQFPDANLQMMNLPKMNHIKRDYCNYKNGAPISKKYTIKSSGKSKTSSIATMLEACDDPSTIAQIKQILSKNRRRASAKYSKHNYFFYKQSKQPVHGCVSPSSQNLPALLFT